MTLRIPAPCPNGYLWLINVMVGAFLLTACVPKVDSVPPPPIVQEVKVAVPVACEVAQVAQPAYPAKQARKGDNIHTLTKIALADRRVRMGENVELRAANTSPCPAK